MKLGFRALICSQLPAWCWENYFPSLGLHLSENDKVLKPSRTLWGSWAQKSFCVPHFLFVRNRLQPPWPSLSSKGQVQTVANQGREGMQKQGRNSQETIVQPWGRVLVPPQGTHITISLSSSAELKPHQMEDVNCLMKHSSFQREGHSLITLRTTEAHQETTWGQIKGTTKLIRRPPEARLKECGTCPHPDPYQQPCPWSIAIQLLAKSPWVGTHSFWGHEPAVSPLCLVKQ